MNGHRGLPRLPLLRKGFLFLLLAAAGQGGCISLNEARMDVVHYELQVTQGGVPLAGARVRIWNRQEPIAPEPGSAPPTVREAITPSDGRCRFDLEIPVYTGWTHFGASATGGFGGLRVRIEREGTAAKELDIPVRSFIKDGNDFHRAEAVEMSK